MSSAERFVTLLVGIITIISLGAGMLGLLWRISWRTGQIVERFGDHVAASGKVHEDQEQRLRNLERPLPRRR